LKEKLPGLVLIERRRHDRDMFGYVVIALLLIVGPLAVAFGADSRIDEVARRRRLGH
jgi:hypothetical protein